MLGGGRFPVAWGECFGLDTKIARELQEVELSFALATREPQLRV